MSRAQQQLRFDAEQHSRAKIYIYLTYLTQLLVFGPSGDVKEERREGRGHTPLRLAHQL